MSQQQIGYQQDAQMTLAHLRQMCESGDHLYQEQVLYQTERVLSGDNEKLCLAWSLLEAGQLDDALAAIRELPASSDPATDASVESLAKALARAYCVGAEQAEARGLWREALQAYESALLADASYVHLLDRLAWLLATCPMDELRDGARAVRAATQACEPNRWENAACIDVLAAAYAETGDFLSAIRRQKTAIGLLSEDERTSVRTDYVGRLHLYEAGEPYHRKNALPMVAWWKLDEAADGSTPDASGHGLDGGFVGDARIVEDSERGSVLSLEGQGYVDCGDDVAFDVTGPITLAAWIKVHAFDVGHQTIVAKGDTAWRLDRDYGNNTVRFACSGVTALGGGWSTVPGETSVNDGQWHHVVGVYDRMTMYLYVDGDLDASTVAYGKITANDQPFFIGANSQARGRKWKGLIDDVRLYNYVLTRDEVRDIYATEEMDAAQK